MANKRMFSMKIVDSDAFLDMPLSTQCLYFHLNMRADDDGFVDNAKRIMRLIGSSEDDLKLLISKRFVLCFEHGVIVIKHWRMHNTLSSGRYHETQYLDEKSMLRLKENGSYSLEEGMEINDQKYIEMFKRRTSGEQVENADKDLDIDKDLVLDKDLDIDKDRKESISKDIPKKSETVYFPEDEKLNQAFVDYLYMRKRIRKPIATERALNLALNKLRKLSTIPFTETMDNDLAIEILEQSILNSWQGLFEIKEHNSGKPKNGKRDLMQELFDA